MSKMAHMPSYFIAIYDEDRRLYTVVGPVTDDTPWVERVSQAQMNGRVKLIGDRGMGGLSRAEFTQQMQQFLNYIYTEEPIVLP